MQWRQFVRQGHLCSDADRATTTVSLLYNSIWSNHHPSNRATLCRATNFKFSAHFGCRASSFQFKCLDSLIEMPQASVSGSLVSAATQISAPRSRARSTNRFATAHPDQSRASSRIATRARGGEWNSVVRNSSQANEQDTEPSTSRADISEQQHLFNSIAAFCGAKTNSKQPRKTKLSRTNAYCLTDEPAATQLREKEQASKAKASAASEKNKKKVALDKSKPKGSMAFGPDTECVVCDKKFGQKSSGWQPCEQSGCNNWACAKCAGNKNKDGYMCLDC